MPPTPQEIIDSIEQSVEENAIYERVPYETLEIHLSRVRGHVHSVLLLYMSSSNMNQLIRKFNKLKKKWERQTISGVVYGDYMCNFEYCYQEAEKEWLYGINTYARQ